MFPSPLRGPAALFVVDSLGTFGAVPAINGSMASGIFPAANRVIYIPFRLPQPLVVQQLYCINGSAVSGNVDVGVYTLDGTKILSSGSTAQAGTNQKQLFNVTDTLLGIGAYYMGLTLDNITGTFFRFAPTVQAVLTMFGLLAENPAGFGLPANASFASLADAYYPQCGLLAQTVM